VFLRKKGIPALREASDWVKDEGIPKFKTFAGHVKTVAGHAKDVAKFLNDLPDAAKIAGLTALFGGIAAMKVRGGALGGGGALGSVGRAVGLAKPVPVFVTNAGALGGGAGGVGSKIPPAIIPTGEALSKGAKIGSRLRGIAPILPAAGAYGNDTLPKMLPAMTDAEIERWKSVNAEAGKFADATRKLPNQMDLGKTAAEGLLSEILKVERSDPKVQYTAPGFDILFQRTKDYKSLLDGLDGRLITTIMQTRYVKNDTGEGGGTNPQPPNRSGDGVTVNIGKMEASNYNDMQRQIQDRALRASLSGRRSNP
jgi:hypothetical protein